MILIEEAHSSGARYTKACEIVGISLRTLQRWKRDGLKDRRKGARKHVVRKLSPVIRQEIITVCNESRFQDRTPYEIVALLLDEGRYLASVRTFYRILKEENLLHHRSNSRVPSKRSKPPERVADKPNKVWTWDITWMPRDVKGLFFYAYVIIDIFDRSIVGWSVHEEESDSHGRDLFHDTISRQIPNKKAKDLFLHSDNGNPMKGITLLAFLASLRVSISYSRPRVSNDNPFIESYFKTLKYTTNYPLHFKTLTSAREWMSSFIQWYNVEHLHSSLDYVTPEQMRSGKAQNIFRKRNMVMQEARQKFPERWGSRKMKEWKGLRYTALNPEKMK